MQSETDESLNLGYKKTPSRWYGSKHNLDVIKYFFGKSLVIVSILTISMISTTVIISAYLIITYYLSVLANSLNLSRDAALLAINQISQAQFAFVFIIITIITTVSTIKLINKEGS
jgi:hypothetical protein